MTQISFSLRRCKLNCESDKEDSNKLEFAASQTQVKVTSKIRLGPVRWSLHKSGQRVFHGGPSKQKPASIFVLVD
jgi:hypothetical protein